MALNEAYLLIGGNLGNRQENLKAAVAEIENACGAVLQKSSLYETAAWGLKEQPAFLNQVLKINTALPVQQLLQTVLRIEEVLGRERKIKYGPRTIDIDILFYGNWIVNETHLTVPHPQLQNRRFVLVPLAEIASAFLHPVLNKTVAQLLAECPDRLHVHKIPG